MSSLGISCALFEKEWFQGKFILNWIVWIWWRNAPAVVKEGQNNPQDEWTVQSAFLLPSSLSKLNIGRNFRVASSWKGFYSSLIIWFASNKPDIPPLKYYTIIAHYIRVDYVGTVIIICSVDDKFSDSTKKTASGACGYHWTELSKIHN